MRRGRPDPRRRRPDPPRRRRKCPQEPRQAQPRAQEPRLYNPTVFYLPSAKESMTWYPTSHIQTSARKAVLTPFESYAYRLFCYPDLNSLRFASLSVAIGPERGGTSPPFRAGSGEPRSKSSPPSTKSYPLPAVLLLKNSFLR